MMPSGPAMQRVRAAFESRGAAITDSRNGFLTRCPVHEGPSSNPSLNVDQGERGVLLRCRSAGCSADAITAALDLEVRDLFDDKSGASQSTDKQPTKSKRDARGWSSVEAAVAWYRDKNKGAQVTPFLYHDEKGSPYLAVVRIDEAARKRFVQLRFLAGRWTAGAPDRGLPYRLPQLLAAPIVDPVLVVEGERKVDLLERLGFVATCSAQGAKSASRTDWSALADRHVVAFPDNDDPGRAYVEDVRALALAAGAASFVVAELPGLGASEDVVDWAERRSHDEAAQQVAKIVDDAMHGAIREEVGASTAGPAWRALSFDALVALPPTPWLVDGVLPHSGVALMASEPGAGKSFAALDLALRIASQQGAWMERPLMRHGGVAYVALEGHGGLAQRAAAWRAGHPDAAVVDSFELVEWQASALLAPGSSFADELRKCHRRHDGLALVVIDTLTLALEDDENDSAVVGTALRRLHLLARELDCLILLLHHVRKDGAGIRRSAPMSMADVRGSTALAGNVDALLGLEHRPPREQRALLILKSKDGELLPRSWFRLVPVDTGKVDAQGRPVASCIVVPAEPPPDGELDREEVAAAQKAKRLEARRPAVAAEILRLVEARPGLNRTALKSAAGVTAWIAQQVIVELLASGQLVEDRSRRITLPTVPPVLERSSGTPGTGTDVHRNVPFRSGGTRGERAHAEPPPQEGGA